VSKVDVGNAEAFQDRTIEVVLLEGREVGVLRWDETWYAFRNICPHIGARICSGFAHPHVVHEGEWDGTLTADEDRPVLMCPWHRWEYDLETGRSINTKERLQMYPVKLEDGRVSIEMRRKSG
jgi:nitrite reductase (NADH) small subunit